LPGGFEIGLRPDRTASGYAYGLGRFRINLRQGGLKAGL